jgi:hypothetical protein
MIGEGIGRLIAALFCLCVIFVPLGAWKAIEILCWVWSHIHWGAP